MTQKQEPQITTIKPKKKGISPVQFFFILLTLLVFGSLGYFGYMYYQKDVSNRGEIGKLNETLKSTQDELKTTQDLLTTTKTDLENKSKIVDVRTVVPSGARSLTYLSACKVGLAIPDSTKTFDPMIPSTGYGPRTWRLGYQKVVENSLDKKGSPFVGGSEYFVQLLNDEDASGYNPGLVVVKCNKNNGSYTTETLTSAYLKMLRENSSKEAKEAGDSYNANKSIKDLGAQMIWGVDTKKVSILTFGIADSPLENGNLFVAGENVYYVYYASNSSNTKALTSMKEIFNSLVLFSK